MIYQVLETDYKKRSYNSQTNSFDYGHKITYCEFTEDGYKQYDPCDIRESNGQYFLIANPSHHISKNNFYEWGNANVIITELVDEVFNKMEICFYPARAQNILRIWAKKGDCIAIKQFYDDRNNERKKQSGKIQSYLTETVLSMAENLLNIIDETCMLNSRIVNVCYGELSHLLEGFHQKYDRYYQLRLSTTGLKGKKKADVERQSAILQQQYRKFAEIIDNFVELIIDELKIERYIAKAVAWQAIQIKAIEYYGQKWQNEYEPKLENSFDELYKQLGYIQPTIRLYISKVITSENIDAESSREILLYFILHKDIGRYDFNLPKAFEVFYENYRSVKNSIKTYDIKSKLKTTQVRKVQKYSIDDIDLMTGEEFEEFVGLLFRKMGYSSQITKHSGDQGLDVIATRNGLTIGVQAKCYSSAVGNSAVQEAVAGKKFYNCDKVIVITNNYFTSAAIELAQVNGVVLWNRDMLKEKLIELM